MNVKLIAPYTQHVLEIGEKEIPIGVSYKKKMIEELKT
jgi:hypothetical protein